MSLLRDDARAALAARRARASTQPARITLPVLTTVTVACVAAVVLTLAGGSAGIVVGTVAAIAVAAGIAARTTTASLAAGLVLLLVRPYHPGEQVRLFSAAHGRKIDAEIVHIGLLNTTLCTETGLLVVANTRMVSTTPGAALRLSTAAALSVGRGTRSTTDGTETIMQA